MVVRADRVVRECTYRPSITSPPTTILVDPDAMSAKRFSHTARWTWTDEEAMFFASLVLETIKPRLKDGEQMAGLASTLDYINDQLGAGEALRTENKLKKRLTHKRKEK